MALKGSSISLGRNEPFGIGSLWRLTSWGSSAALALVIAVAVAFSERGSQRLVLALSPIAPATGAGASSREASRATDVALAESVRLLAAERDRLVARIGRLERHLDDLTGSIAAASQRPVQISPSASRSEGRPQSGASEAVQTGPAHPTEASADPRQEGRSSATESSVQVATANEPPKGEYGADIGSAMSFEGLRALWSATKASNADVFENLYPLVSVQENSRTRAPQLRLIVGPFADWEGASRFCAAVTGARLLCQPTAFEGQRLADADRPVDRKPASPRQGPRLAPSAQPRLFGLF